MNLMVVIRYWDGFECMLKRTINETCKYTNECIPEQELTCLNGLCISFCFIKKLKID